MVTILRSFHLTAEYLIINTQKSKPPRSSDRTARYQLYVTFPTCNPTDILSFNYYALKNRGENVLKLKRDAFR